MNGLLRGVIPFAKKAHRMAEVIRDEAMVHVDNIWGSEVQLYVPQLYAGTTDLVGTFKGNPAIMDFKQTNKPKKQEWVVDYYLQMVCITQKDIMLFLVQIYVKDMCLCVVEVMTV